MVVVVGLTVVEAVDVGAVLVDVAASVVVLRWVVVVGLTVVEVDVVGALVLVTGLDEVVVVLVVDGGTPIVVGSNVVVVVERIVVVVGLTVVEVGQGLWLPLQWCSRSAAGLSANAAPPTLTARAAARINPLMWFLMI